MTARPALTLAAAALALAACHPKPVGSMGHPGVHVSTAEPTKAAITVASRLACPETVGDWRRTSQAASGASCRYVGAKGEVDLALLTGAPGDPQAILAPERARLDALMPDARNAAIQVVDERGADGRKVSRVDMPFLHVSADGDRKSVQVMGFHVDKRGRSNDEDADADDKPVAVAPGAGTKLVYVLAGARPAPGGWHAMGYDARVDAQGRAVVASFRYAKGDNAGEGDDDGLDQLLAPSVTSAAAPTTADAKGEAQ